MNKYISQLYVHKQSRKKVNIWYAWKVHPYWGEVQTQGFARWERAIRSSVNERIDTANLLGGNKSSGTIRVTDQKYARGLCEP